MPKKIITKVAQFFIRLWRWKKVKEDKKYDDILDKLNVALQKKSIAQDQLKGEIMIYMKKFLGVGVFSRFIPKKYRNDAKVVLEVRKKFGDRMDELGVKITDNAVLI